MPREPNSVFKLLAKNFDQIRKIYDFYASNIDTCRLGSGLVLKTLSFENIKQFLKDFGIMPHFVDIHTLKNMFRDCKYWEWKRAFSRMHDYREVTEEEAELVFAAGNLGLTFPGLLELISRVSNHANLDKSSRLALSSLLKAMDTSGGKHVLAEASRGSIVIRVFSTS